MKKHWIKGEYSESSSGKTFQVINPATEELVDEAARGDASDANRAVEAAYSAFPDWRFCGVWTDCADRSNPIHARRVCALQ